MKGDSFWFPFEPNRWLSNEKLSLVSLEAKGLWIHLLCLLYKANANGSLIIAGNIPTNQQISRMVGRDVDSLIDELKKAGVFEIKNGAIYHQGVANGLSKINSKMDGYKRRDGSKISHLLTKDEPSIDERWVENKSKSKNKNIESKSIAPLRPSLTDWVSYGSEIGWNKADAEMAFDHYQANGWKVGGKAPVKDWRACARNCFRMSGKRNNTQQKGTPNQMQTKKQILSTNGCESPPLYRIMGFSSYSEWQKAGFPS